MAVDEILAVKLAELLEAWDGCQGDGHALVIAVVPGCWCGGCGEGAIDVGGASGLDVVFEGVWRGVEEEEL